MRESNLNFCITLEVIPKMLEFLNWKVLQNIMSKKKKKGLIFQRPRTAKRSPLSMHSVVTQHRKSFISSLREIAKRIVGTNLEAIRLRSYCCRRPLHTIFLIKRYCRWSDSSRAMCAEIRRIFENMEFFYNRFCHLLSLLLKILCDNNKRRPTSLS